MSLICSVPESTVGGAERRCTLQSEKVESGADDIMKVTGHASPKMLKKYTKADSLEVVEKLADKYEYFR